MEKFGNPITEFRGIPLSGYKKNLKGIAPEEIQSTYSIRKEDGKVFYSSVPTMENRLAVDEAWAPIDDSRYGHDKEAEAVRGQAVRAQMFDTYRRTESKRGGGPHDYYQLNEEMVSRDEEAQTMVSLYTRKPDNKALDRRQAVRQMGKAETWNEFDFEHLQNGGLARNYRETAYALEDAKRLQDKKRMDRIKTEFEGNAQDYYSRKDLSTSKDMRSERPRFEKAWQVNENRAEARADFTKPYDPVRIELIQNLKAAQLVAADGTSFVPAKLIEKVNDLGATQAELTELAEVLTAHFGHGNLNKACSVRELVEIVGTAVEMSSGGIPTRVSSRDERAMWNGVTILAKASQLLLAPQGATRASMPSISRISEEFVKREGYLTQQLESGKLNRAQYNAKMYETMSKFHDAVMEVAGRNLRHGTPNEKVVTLLGNAARIFELWTDGVQRHGVAGLSYKEVEVMKDIIAFNNELIEEAGFMRGSAARQQAVPIELFIKAYASQLDNIMRFSSNFDKENPGVRVKYKHAYTKIAEELDKTLSRSAPKALRENAEVLGARYTEILENSRIPRETKVIMLKAIDMSISKADAALNANSRVVDPRTAYEMRNTADLLAKLDRELVEEIATVVDPRRTERESFLGNPAVLAYEDFQAGPRTERHAASGGRGELAQQYKNSTELYGIAQARVNREEHRIGHRAGAIDGTINELRLSDGVRQRSQNFAPGSVADTIANAGYSSAYGGAGEFQTEMMYQHKW